MASGAMKSGDVNTVVQQLSTLATLHSGRGVVSNVYLSGLQHVAHTPYPVPDTGLYRTSSPLCSCSRGLIHMAHSYQDVHWPDSLSRFLGYQWENFFGLTEIYAYLVHPVGLNVTSETSILCGSTLHWTFSCSRSPLLISAPRLDDLCIQLVDCIGW
jgi:hypothetical protein